MRSHDCKERAKVERAVAAADRPAPSHWGEAISDVVWLNGNWWAVAGEPPEYATAIRFCPWCGVPLGQGVQQPG